MQLTIGEHDKGTAVISLDLVRVGHTGRNAHPMAERSGRCFNPRHPVIRMGSQPPRRCTVLIEVAPCEHAEIFKDHILRQAAMALRHKKIID